jgi:hypothetical protein
MRLHATKLGAISTSTSRGLGDPLYDIAGSQPALDLNFAITKALDSRITFTRSSVGTYIGSDGLLKTAVVNEPRFTHNPTTGESLGLLVEEPRTNLLLNSATLSTQSVTVTAVSTTLSFYGTGTITLTGTSTAGPLVGTGVNNRVSLTFTPTAGSLTLTVSGSVTNAQLEAGAFSTSYIPTTGATATRTADLAQITGTNFSSFYNATAGTMYAEVSTVTAAYGRAFVGNQTYYYLYRHIGGAGAIYDGANLLLGSALSSPGANNKLAMAYGSLTQSLSTNGSSAVSGTSTNFTGSTLLTIGGPSGIGTEINGTIRRISYWPSKLANATLQQLTQ